MLHKPHNTTLSDSEIIIKLNPADTLAAQTQSQAFTTSTGQGRTAFSFCSSQSAPVHGGVTGMHRRCLAKHCHHAMTSSFDQLACCTAQLLSDQKNSPFRPLSTGKVSLFKGLPLPYVHIFNILDFPLFFGVLF